MLLSGVTVNALAFTFRIAYQKAGCSIFVLVLNVQMTIEQPLLLGRVHPHIVERRDVSFSAPEDP